MSRHNASMNAPTLRHFQGGVHPPEHKAESNAAPIQPMPLLARYVAPLRQHIGAVSAPRVRVGDHVLKGQLLGAPQGRISAAVHAPTSGTVTAIAPHATPHPSGLYDTAVVIEADGADRGIDFTPLDWRALTPDALRQALRNSGLVGLGGAVFPSHVKLDAPVPGRPALHTLILNGAECEPWITCDDRLMRERAAEILQGAAIMARLLGASTVLIGVEDNKPEAIDALRAALRAAPDAELAHARVVGVPTLYPSGGGKQLTYLLTGLETPSGGLSTDLGIQVFNVGTAHALYRAVVLGEPLISRVVTVSGHVARPGNFEARIGTPIADLIQAAGGALPGASGEIIGGPMMGYTLMDLAAPVTKGVNCVLVKSPALFPEKPRALPCIRCGACARACPASLQPFELYWFSRAKDFGKAQSYKLFDCIECGCCSYVCPSHIPLVDFYRYAKSEIWAREQEKQASDQARMRHEFKNYRLEREKQEKAEKFAKAAAETRAKAAESGASGPASATPADAEAARKQALLDAALARAAKTKAELAAAGITPRNTEADRPEVAAQIAAAEARRARLAGAAATPSNHPPAQD